MNQINSFLSALKTMYSQQGQFGKILLPALLVVAFCCLCSLLIPLLPARNSPDITPSPIILPSGTVATPTALFNFDFPTFTPFPTLPPPTAFPTFTPAPTETQTSTPILPTATETLIPTATVTITIPTATVSSSGSVRIVDVNKRREYVDLQNVGNAPVNLAGWKLVSERGDQSCTLSGVLQPNEVLRIWSGTGTDGFSCGFPSQIWTDNRRDPAVLFDAQGEEVSRFP